MPKSLLVADDSLTIRKVIGMILAADDFQITAVDNGLEAVSKARELRPDLVLADVMMPGKSGYEVCEVLKADPGTRAIPVLLLAGNFEPFDESRAKAVKADDYIIKPFESQSLLDKVRTLTGLPKEPETPRKIFMPESAGPTARSSVAVPESSRPPISVPVPSPMPARPSGAGAHATGAARTGPPNYSGQHSIPRPPNPAPAPGANLGRPPVQPAARPTVPSIPNATIPQYRMPSNSIPRASSPGVPGPGNAVARQPGNFGPVRGPPYPSAPAAQPFARGPVNVGAAYPRAPAAAAARGPSTSGSPASPQPRPTGARPNAPVVPGSTAYYAPVMGSYPPAHYGQPAGQAHPSPADGGEAMLREALTRASKEVIEKIAWEIVPQLAETIIREHLDQLIKDRNGRS